MGKMGKLFTKCLKLLWSWIRQFYYIKRFRQIRQIKRRKSVWKGVGSTTYEFHQSEMKNEEDTEDNNQLNDEENGVAVGYTVSHPAKYMNEEENNQIPFSNSNSVSGLKNCKPVMHDTVSVDSYHPFIVDDNYNLPLWVSVIIWIVYILLGASMYSTWETSWSYLDAVYFVFVSISTIGFGDIVPTQNYFFLMTSVYILFGLALVAMVISVLAQFFTRTIEHVHKTVTHIHVPAILRSPVSAVYLQQEGTEKQKVMNALPPISKKNRLRVMFKRERRASF